MRNIPKPLFSTIVLSLGLSFGVFFVGLMTIPKAYAAAAGEHLIIIHDRDTDKGIMTKARTLRAALKEAHISVDKHDMVQPGLDEELISNSYQVNIYRARPVVIIDGQVRQMVMSAYQTPKQIAKHAGIELQDEDRAEVDLNTNFITDGASLRMTIDRALPVELTLYGKQSTVYTQAETVGEFLAEKNIKLGTDDDLSPKPDAPIINGMKLSIWRNGKQTITQEEDVAFDTDKIQDANRDAGYREVTTPGVNGRKIVTYEIIMQDGREVSRTVIQSVVTKQPVKQVETIGTKVAISGPAEIIALINQYSAQRGLDATKVARIAKCESGFNPMAGNGRYQGLFQHDSTAWAGRAQKYGVPGASIYDARAQVIVSTGMMAASGYGAWECQ